MKIHFKRLNFASYYQFNLPAISLSTHMDLILKIIWSHMPTIPVRRLTKSPNPNKLRWARLKLTNIKGVLTLKTSATKYQIRKSMTTTLLIIWISLYSQLLALLSHSSHHPRERMAIRPGGLLNEPTQTLCDINHGAYNRNNHKFRITLLSPPKRWCEIITVWQSQPLIYLYIHIYICIAFWCTRYISIEMWMENVLNPNVIYRGMVSLFRASVDVCCTALLGSA